MKNWLLPLVAVGVLALLFVLMRPKPPTPVVAAAPVAAPAAPDAGMATSAAPAVVVEPPQPTGPAPQTIELVVKDKKLVTGPQVISVAQDTSVTLRITVDRHDELHLHGYDLTLKLPTAEAAELRFVADRSGRFEYELHHSHVDLGVLEVQPR